jgi:hypothetical protein
MKKQYFTVSDNSDTTDGDSSSIRCGVDAPTGRNDNISVASHHRRFRGHKRISSELSQPLTSTGTGSVIDESLGGGTGGDTSDPYFLFRSDLQKKLDLLDECLADYLRVVHETVRAVY